MVVKSPGASGALGPSLRRAWVGYQQRLDERLAARGFADRRFPDGRVLRICAARRDMTIAGIGRELGVSRQAAAKTVAGLAERGYVQVVASPSDQREKLVRITRRGRAFLEAHREAASSIEAELRGALGAKGFEALGRLLVALDAEGAPRLSDYLRSKAVTRSEGR